MRLYKLLQVHKLAILSATALLHLIVLLVFLSRALNKEQIDCDNQLGRSDPLLPVSRRTECVVEHRFRNGIISLTDSRFLLLPELLKKLSDAALVILYEKVVLEVTADCSTSRRIGRAEDGGWNLCLVGPYKPKPPCFSFSFGIGGIWEFDDQMANLFKCQVAAFDPSLPMLTHARSKLIHFFREGLSDAKGLQGSWKMDSLSGFLKRLKAERLVIDILKIDIESSEWSSLEAALKDGSLRNVKQLLIETHLWKHRLARINIERFLSVLWGLHELGFRQWHHNWNELGNYQSTSKGKEHRTCCHELYYINKNFLSSGATVRSANNSSMDGFQ